MEALLAGVSWKAVGTLAILAAAIYGFISEKFGPDVTAFLALLALLLTGILTPGEAFSGLVIRQLCLSRLYWSYRPASSVAARWSS